MMHKLRMQRRSSENESYLSATSPSKTHRRSSPFVGSSSIRLGRSEGKSISSKSSRTKADNPLLRFLRASLSSGITASSRADMTMTHRSSDTKVITHNDGSFSAVELIRQLSFSPPRRIKKKKRANSDETEASSLFDSSSDGRHSIDLDLDLDIDPKQTPPPRRSPSPLLGLKYLEDGDDDGS
jgi:hypothetical protein